MTTDAYSKEEPIKDTNIEPHNPDIKENPVNGAVDFKITHENADNNKHSIRKSVVLKIQPLRDLDIDIWSN